MGCGEAGIETNGEWLDAAFKEYRKKPTRITSIHGYLESTRALSDEFAIAGQKVLLHGQFFPSKADPYRINLGVIETQSATEISIRLPENISGIQRFQLENENGTSNSVSIKVLEKQK